MDHFVQFQVKNMNTTIVANFINTCTQLSINHYAQTINQLMQTKLIWLLG